jgi:hypothetical protein
MTWDLFINIVGLIALPLAGFAVAQRSKDREEAREALADRANLNDAAHAALHLENEENRKYVERLNVAFSSFQLDVAQRYATMIALQQMEQRFVTVIERFEDKLDRHLLQDRPR